MTTTIKASAPRKTVGRGLGILAVFALAHLCGLRAYVCVLVGSSPAGGPPGVAEVVLGATYGVLYFAAVVAAPVLILAGLIQALISVCARRAQRPARAWRDPGG